MRKYVSGEKQGCFSKAGDVSMLILLDSHPDYRQKIKMSTKSAHITDTGIFSSLQTAGPLPAVWVQQHLG